MENKLKLLIKEAILEALAEFSNQGVSTAAKDPDNKPGGPIEPDPMWGPVGFGLR